MRYTGFGGTDMCFSKLNQNWYKNKSDKWMVEKKKKENFIQWNSSLLKRYNSIINGTKIFISIGKPISIFNWLINVLDCIGISGKKNGHDTFVAFHAITCMIHALFFLKENCRVSETLFRNWMNHRNFSLKLCCHCLGI